MARVTASDIARLKEFAARVFAEEEEIGLPAQTVMVMPGGARFSTITDALNSITNASSQTPYQVIVGPGTYQEPVMCKSWVQIKGPTRQVATIAFNTTAIARAAVVAVSSSSIRNMTISATSLAGAAPVYGIDLVDARDFAIGNSVITAYDNDFIGVPEAVGIRIRGRNQTPSVYLVETSITALGDDNSTLPIAVDVHGGYVSMIEVGESSVSGGNGIGVSAASGALINLQDCKVTGQAWSLYLADAQSQITATACTLTGNYSEGVIIQ